MTVNVGDRVGYHPEHVAQVWEAFVIAVHDNGAADLEVIDYSGEHKTVRHVHQREEGDNKGHATFFTVPSGRVVAEGPASTDPFDARAASPPATEPPTS